MYRHAIILLVLSAMLTGCVSLNQYTELNKRYKDLEAQQAQASEKASSCESEIRTLQEKNDQLTATMSQIRKGAELQYNKAMSFYKTESYTEAIKEFEKLTDRYPADPLAAAAFDKLAEINTLAAANYQKITKALDALKDPKARIDLLDKEIADKYLSAADLEKILHRREACLNDLRMQEDATRHIVMEDDPTQSTRYYRSTRNLSQEIDRNKSFYVELYVAQHYSGKKILRLKTQYFGNKWISYDTVALKGDGVQLEIICKYPDKMASMNNERIHEWSDNEVDEEKMIKIAKAETITARFNGGYKYALVLDDEQMTSFKEIVKKFQTIK